jgi:Domain of unknown function (DUF5753)
MELSFVIDESVLLRGFAPAPVMREQLTHLAEMSEYSNIELRILPLAGSQVIGTGAFVYFRFQPVHGVPAADAVAFEHLQDTTFVESEQDVHTYQLVFNALSRASLSVQASRDTLARVSREARTPMRSGSSRPISTQLPLRLLKALFCQEARLTSAEVTARER